MHQRAAPADQTVRDPVIRWVCRCQQPPVLLATYDPTGTVHIKVRDRYWHTIGRVWTTCPRCGTEHTLESLAGTAEPAGIAPAPDVSAS